MSLTPGLGHTPTSLAALLDLTMGKSKARLRMPRGRRRERLQCWRNDMVVHKEPFRPKSGSAPNSSGSEAESAR